MPRKTPRRADRGNAPQEATICDYSLRHVVSRPAAIGDKLVSTAFIGTITRGFAEVGAPNVAVCLLPGTEIAFDKEVAYYDLPGYPQVALAGAAVARFRQVEPEKRHQHHDALEFPDGKIVMLTSLCEGQKATVLQLPADPVKRAEVAESSPIVTTNTTAPLDLIDVF